MPPKTQLGPTWKEIQVSRVINEQAKAWDDICALPGNRHYWSRSDWDKYRRRMRRMVILYNKMECIDPNEVFFPPPPFGPPAPAPRYPRPPRDRPTIKPKMGQWKEALRSLKKMRSALSAVTGSHSYYGGRNQV